MTVLSFDYVINKVNDIKSLPDIILKIIDLTNDPDSTVRDMEALILKDQVFTSKVLRLANSAYYGYARKISTISQATVLLGFQAIKGIALASMAKDIMAEELKGYSLAENILWQQSQTCAIISRHIAKTLKLPEPEEAYIAGLLRDLGKTVLNEHMETEYATVLEKVESEGITFLDAENEVFGYDHAEIGGKIAARWGLPAVLIDAISHHHTPDLADVNPILVSIVHIADAITMMLGVGLGVDGLTYNFSPTALEILKLDDMKLQNIISDVSDLIKDTDSFE